MGDIAGFATYICFKETEKDQAKHCEILGENDLLEDGRPFARFVEVEESLAFSQEPTARCCLQ